LEDLRQHGKVALWGAGAKGATFANLLDPECSLLDCVVDINPNKQGRFIPERPIRLLPRRIGWSRHPKRDFDEPNYHDENERLLARAGIDVI